MGRPPKPASEKRVQVNVRLLPAHRQKLQEAADANGRPLASEAEAILAAALSRSPETRALLDRIAAKIEEMERAAKGQWWKNLKPWAAVSQMLQTIVDDDRPERLIDDEPTMRALMRENDLKKERAALVRRLADMNVAVNENPRSTVSLGERRYRGIFNALHPQARTQDSRTWERAMIDAMPPDHPKLDEIKTTFAELLELDKQIEQAGEALMEAARPLFEAEEEGRRIGGKPPLVPNALLSAANTLKRQGGPSGGA